MPMLRHLFLSLVALAVMGGAARAQEPTASHLAAARELLLMTGSLTSVETLIPQFGESIKRRQVTRPELAKDLNEVIEALKPEMELQRQQMINAGSRVYAQHFTEAQIKDVIAFFKTPSGALYLKEQPQLVDDVVNAVEVWTQQVSEYTMVRVRAEMAKRGFQMQ